MGKKILYGDNLEIGYIKRDLPGGANIMSKSSLSDINKIVDDYKYIILDKNDTMYDYKGYTNIDEIKDKITFKFDIFTEHLEQFNKKDEEETSLSDSTKPKIAIDYNTDYYKVYAIVEANTTKLTNKNTNKDLLIEVLRQYQEKNTETNNTIDKYIQNLEYPYVTNLEKREIYNAYQSFLKLFDSNKKENNTESKTYIRAEVYDKGKINLAKDDILQTYKDTISTKKEIVDKMKDDVQIMNRGIQESKEKDSLQNKIKITLSIIIILFAVFCFSYIIYNFVGDNIKKNIKSKLPGFIRGDLAESTKASFVKSMS